MFNEHEYFFQCPYCYQTISMVIESLYGDQSYIEDCEVCCRPIEIEYQTQDNEVINFQAKSLDG